MRATHIISNLGIGGAEGALCTLIEAQAGTAVEHTVVSMTAHGAYAGRLRAAGATVVELDGTRSLRFAVKFAELGRAIAGSRPDIVQGWMYHGNVAGSMLRLAGYFSCPVLWGVRQSISRLSDDVLLTRCVILGGAALARQPRHIVYNSRVGASTHERLGYPVAKRVVIHNGVDCERFRPRPAARALLLAELDLPASALLVGRIARYASMKDFGTLFEAFRHVREAQPSANLLLVGAGTERTNAELVAVWHRAGAPDGVHFLGPRLDIENVFPALDVAVSSSSSNEGFSNAVFEAIACGTPVVTTNVGTGEEFRECGASVVEPRRPLELAAAVRACLAMSPEARRTLTDAARAIVVERYGVQAFAAEFLSLWQATLAPAGGEREE